MKQYKLTDSYKSKSININGFFIYKDKLTTIGKLENSFIISKMIADKEIEFVDIDFNGNIINSSIKEEPPIIVEKNITEKVEENYLVIEDSELYQKDDLENDNYDSEKFIMEDITIETLPKKKKKKKLDEDISFKLE